MYADDGILYGEQLKIPDPDQYIDSGIKFHPDKSGYVKKDNIWIKPLKFLGMIYDGNTDEWRADTRGRLPNPSKGRKGTLSLKHNWRIRKNHKYS